MRSLAKQAVMAVPEKRTEKDLSRAKSLLSSIVSDFAKDGIDECEKCGAY